MSTPKPWPADRPSGCRKRERELDCAAVSRQPQERRRGWTSFIDAVEEELVDAFLIAPDEVGEFCGRSQCQKLVWKACKSPSCDKFLCGSYEMQSWRRKSRICKHILAARQRLDELLLRGAHSPHSHFGPGPRAAGARQTGTQAGCCSCEPGPVWATSIFLEAPAANRCNAASLDDTDYGR